MLVHFAFLAYVVAGGFLAWRRPVMIWPHLVLAGWGLSTLVFHQDCPLSRLETWARLRAGEPGLRHDGFIETYLTGVVYPARYLWLVQVLAAVVIGVSWAGALSATPTASRSSSRHDLLTARDGPPQGMWTARTAMSSSAGPWTTSRSSSGRASTVVPSAPGGARPAARRQPGQPTVQRLPRPLDQPVREEHDGRAARQAQPLIGPGDVDDADRRVGIGGQKDRLGPWSDQQRWRVTRARPPSVQAFVASVGGTSRA